MSLALIRTLLVPIDQHHVNAGARRNVADAGAHEARADDGQFLHLGRRHVLRTPCAFVQLLHRQEQAADHRRSFLAAQNLREVPRFDPQRGVDRQLQSFVNALHDRARRRIIIVGLAAEDRVSSRKHHHAGFGIDGATWQPEVLVVPRRKRLAAALDPLLGRCDQVGGRNHGIDQLQRLGFGEIDRLALEQQLHRVLRWHDARHALGAAGTGEKSDLDFRQAQPGLGIFSGHTVMAG